MITRYSPESLKLLKRISHKEYHLAFDHPNYQSGVGLAIDLLQSEGINRCNWYVLVGYDTTFQEDLNRLNYLRERGQRAFVQRYESVRGNRQYQALADWTNQHNFFAKKTFSEFLDLRRDRRRLKIELIESGRLA